MKIYEITQSRNSQLLEAVGRDLQHVEDLVFIHGSEGATHAVRRLREVGANSKVMTIKFDGSPACKFGRDDTGRFHFGDKHSKEMILSAEDLEQQVLSRKYAGKGEPAVDAARQEFAKRQSAIWKLYESATPANFRGFVSGDLLWQAPPKVVNGEYVVAPNTVRYLIDVNSPLGEQMKQSQTGVALHFYSQTFDGPATPITSQVLAQLGNSKVTVLGPTTTANVPQATIDASKLAEVDRLISQHGSEIDEYLAPVTGLSNVPAVIYKYVNSHQADATPEHFLQWAEQTLSAGQFAKLSAKSTSGLEVIFEIMHKLVDVKVNIIDQLESQTLGNTGIRAILHKTNTPGGEGLVLPAGEDTPPLKFVNRNTFSAANKIR